MHFLEHIQDKLCHPSSIVQQEGNILHCQTCQMNFHPYEFIQSFENDHIFPSRLAQSYFEWTGDSNVPLPFTIWNIEGILNTRVTGQTLRHVEECIDLLRAINSPFTSTLHTPSYDLNSFLRNYLHILSTHHTSTNEPHMDELLNYLLKFMHEIVQSNEFENPFQLYFEKLVPFVQQSKPGWEVRPSTPRDPNLAKELMYQLQLSNSIRKEFGIFAIPFDIIHVMLGCFVSSSDSNLVANWVLDFMARFCRGHYFWTQHANSPFVQSIQKFLNREISRRNKVEFYRVAQNIKNGEAAECLSGFWQHYIDLQSFVGQKFNIPQIPYDIVQVALQQTFPAVLFEDPGDHLGFLVALAYIFSKTNKKTGVIEKGSFKKGKEIHNKIKNFVKSVKDFDSIRTYWVVDTFQLFLASIPDLGKQLTEVFEMFMKDE